MTKKPQLELGPGVIFHPKQQQNVFCRWKKTAQPEPKVKQIEANELQAKWNPNN